MDPLYVIHRVDVAIADGCHGAGSPEYAVDVDLHVTGPVHLPAAPPGDLLLAVIGHDDQRQSDLVSEQQQDQKQQQEHLDLLLSEHLAQDRIQEGDGLWDALEDDQAQRELHHPEVRLGLH